MAPRIGLLLGDPSGIGPELVARLLAAEDRGEGCRVVVIGDWRVYRRLGERVAGVDNGLRVFTDAESLPGTGSPALLDVPTIDPAEVTPGRGSAAAGRSVLDTLAVAVDLARAGAIDAICFAPLNKQSLHLGGNPHGDDIHRFAELLGVAGPFGEINVLDDLWTSRVTSHIPLSEVAAGITREAVTTAIELLHGTLDRSGISRPRIAVAALNPHAGEGGLFGREEIDTIRPAIEAARERSIDADGPWPADTVFLKARAGDYDAVVTMYHDQGQVAMKLMGFERGVTVLGGLPLPVTTPAHGTAFDIVGKGTASVEGLRRALLLACRLAEGHRPGR